MLSAQFQSSYMYVSIALGNLKDSETPTILYVYSLGSCAITIALCTAAHSLCHHQVSSQPEVEADPCRDPNYAEPAVDAMRAQKDEELQRYRQQCEKKARDLARQKGTASQTRTRGARTGQ